MFVNLNWILCNALCRHSINNHNIYNLSNAVDILRDPHYHPFLPTVVYVHGWTESPASLSIQTVIGAYLQTRKWNTIILDWQTLASPEYEIAVGNVAPVRFIKQRL